MPARSTDARGICLSHDLETMVKPLKTVEATVARQTVVVKAAASMRTWRRRWMLGVRWRRLEGLIPAMRLNERDWPII